MSDQHSQTDRAETRQAILEALGARVRSLREERGLPRRALADLSGVSPRFLAQLESGEGNISVARLADVALALGATPAALLDPAADRMLEAAAQNSAVTARIHALLGRRSENELREVLTWLEARFHPASGPTVALLGVRGAGKSTVGQRLAERLELPFHELDQLIEEVAGLTLGEIFELHGEAYYRRLERETLLHYLADHPTGVLATGGSLVTDRESFRLLRRRALTVWLKARPEDHWNRVIQQGDQRPMAQNPHAMQELRALLAAREKLYAEAEYTIDTAMVPIDEVVDRLAEMVQRHL